VDVTATPDPDPARDSAAVANALADLVERARASFLLRADTIEGPLRPCSRVV